MTFPMARSLFPPKAATVQTTSSGAEVPNETMVSPTTMGLTPSEPARRAAPRTSHSAPKYSTPIPPTRRKMSPTMPGTIS